MMLKVNRIYLTHFIPPETILPLCGFCCDLKWVSKTGGRVYHEETREADLLLIQKRRNRGSDKYWILRRPVPTELVTFTAAVIL